MNDTDPDILVLRKGTEGLSTEPYAETLRCRLSEHEVIRARTPNEERQLIRTARVATGTGLREELVERAESLELFVAASSGTNHIPVDRLSEQGVVVSNAAGIHAPGIAEQALGACLMFARRLHEGLDRKERSEWRHYKADEFTESTVTVVGLGAIGQAFISRLQGMDVSTIGVRLHPEKGGPTDEVIGFDDREFHDALSRTDYLVLSTPLSDVTRGLIGKEEFATLPPHAVLVNVCRGAVVETDALVSALQKEVIAGAAVDVTDPEPLPPESPLWQMKNVLITPHMGGHTPKHWDRLADILVDNVTKLDNGAQKGFRNQVNSGELAKSGATVASRSNSED